MRRLLYPAPVTFDLLGYERDVYADEILERTKLLMAEFDSNLTKYGIVDSSDPATAYAGGTRPLSVSVNGSNPSTVNIYPGTAVFKSGEIIYILSSIAQVDLANGGANGRNIVYLEFGEQEKNPVTTRTLTPTNSIVDYYTDPSDYVKVLDVDDYEALDPVDKDLTIPLAVVTVQVVSSGGGTATQLAIDMERTTADYNRPWFSVVDAEHRSYIGTGVVSDVNAHGLSFNDISATSEQTLFQLILDYGMIVAKDKGLAGVPGTICEEVIPASSIYADDAAGTITGISFANYFVLSRFPLLIVRVTDEETETKDYAPVEVPGKNLCFLIPNDEYAGTTYASITVPSGGTYPTGFIGGETIDLIVDSVSFTVIFTVLDQTIAGVLARINAYSNVAGVGIIATNVGGQICLTSNTLGASSNITISGGTACATLGLTIPPLASLTSVGFSGNLLVKYSAVEALEPPAGFNNITYPVNQPASKETVIADGIILSSLSSSALTFEDAGQIPAGYHAYVDGDGVIQRYPQTVYCFRKLVDVGYTLQNFDTATKGSSKLRVGLAGSSAGPLLSVKLEITGKNLLGSTITEEVVFDNTWVGSSIPTCTENASQWKTTTNAFSELTSWILTERLNDGPLSAITIQALVNPVTTEELADVLPVAYLMWDGLQICDIIDERPINSSLKLKTLSPVSGGARGTCETAGLLWDREQPASAPNYVFHFWAEDFDRPGWISTEVTDTTLGEGLSPTETLITKVYPGLGPDDTYVSRPIAVSPNTAKPNAIRFIPIEPGITFNMKARYYTLTGGWQNWVDLGHFDEPNYTIDLTAVTAGDIVKWQMYVAGEVRGMIISYLADNTFAHTKAGSFIWDVGAWDEGTYGGL